jgi:hypothetical protein
MLVESESGQDSASVVHYDFPATFGNGFPADLITFLGSYFIDVNNDAVLDLVVSPNADNDAADSQSVLLYINEGSNASPSFTRIQDDFLQDRMIDLGVGAYPTAGDVDGDGLVDLIVANRKRFNLEESYTSRLHFFKNTGSANAPAFDLANANLLDIPSLQWSSVAPALGDLDGDGDADLVVGDLDGLLHRFTNTSQGGTLSFELLAPAMTSSTGETIDVGQSATPQIFDVDSDGKNDLLVGCLNGSVVYYRNVGTAALPSFEWQTDSLGQAVALSLLGIQGKSVPCMTRNDQGDLRLLLGTETGLIMEYGGIETNLQGTFELLSDDFEHIREGARTALASTDFNGDGLNDLIIGNTGGGLAIWMHQPVGTGPVVAHHNIGLFPNPASNRVSLLLPQEFTLPVRLAVLDEQGRVLIQEILTSSKFDLNVQGLSNGCYVVHLVSDQLAMNKRLVIRR